MKKLRISTLLLLGFLVSLAAAQSAQDESNVLVAENQNARLQVIHNAADPNAQAVDVYLEGTLLLDDFAFRTATPFIDAPAGTPINVGIAPGNSTSAADTLVNFTLTLTAGETYVAVANGVLNPAAFAANPDGKATG
ncbi:DUF4397 domain-containing protein, partial [candidate division KSB1 bacterium]|nr:DUF4397 domain-containing protein [candidate division KSB1 bacterium]